MSLPQDLIQPIKKVKNVEMRILITCLVLTAMALASSIVYLFNGNIRNNKVEIHRLEGIIEKRDARISSLESRVSDLELKLYDKSEEEANRLRKRYESYDTLIKKGNQLLKQ